MEVNLPFGILYCILYTQTSGKFNLSSIVNNNCYILKKFQCGRLKRCKCNIFKNKHYNTLMFLFLL